MGHLVFILMHLGALLFWLPALFVTIPLHVIYAATRKAAPNGLKCPDCKEVVDREARVCKHCGAQLVPESEMPPLGLGDRLMGGPRRQGMKRQP